MRYFSLEHILIHCAYICPGRVYFETSSALLHGVKFVVPCTRYIESESIARVTAWQSSQCISGVDGGTVRGWRARSC